MSNFVNLVRRDDVVNIDVLSWTALLKLAHLQGWGPVDDSRGDARVNQAKRMSRGESQRLVLALVRALPDIPAFDAYGDEEVMERGFTEGRVRCIAQWWCNDMRRWLTKEILPFLAGGSFFIVPEEPLSDADYQRLSKIREQQSPNGIPAPPSAPDPPTDRTASASSSPSSQNAGINRSPLVRRDEPADPPAEDDEGYPP